MSFYPKVNAAPERLDIVTSTSSATSCDVLIACAPGTCGNVGQLAVDVLALNLNLHRVGAVDFEHLVPVTGRDALFDDLAPDDVGAVASACEVYAGKVITANGDETSVVAVQIRSDANIGARRVFCDEYVDFITSFASAKRIVLMSSLPSTYGALASQIGGTKWRRSGGNEAFVKVCDACELPELESNVRAPDDEDEPSVDPHWALVDALRARDASRPVHTGARETRGEHDRRGTGCPRPKRANRNGLPSAPGSRDGGQPVHRSRGPANHRGG